MEAEMFLITALSAFISAILIILYKILSNSHNKSSNNNLPPSPPGSLPILGHLLLFKTVIHRALHDFSQNVGPIFSVRLGPRLVVVVSSSELVHECFTKNDIVLANRPQPAVDRRSLGFSSTTVIGAQYGTHWRNLRKLCDLEVFAPTRLASFLSIRRDEMDRTISSLYRISSSVVGFAKVNVEAKIVELTFNNIMRMLVGKRYYGEEAEDDEESKKFKELTKEALLLTDPSNIEEIFPMLRWIGCNRLEKKLATHSRKTDEFMTRLLDQHRRGDRRRDNHNMVVDNLLSLQESQPEYYTDEIIMDLIVAIVIAGTDASVVTTEWAMSLLLNHPDVLMKARQELDTLVGHDRLVQEHDLPKLRYLHFIVLETLRLFPSVPTLVPHAPSQDCEIGGYNVPKNTMIIINARAVQRDPKVWDDPLSFKPERFEKIELETHKFLPFGMGRRACPGAGLAQKLVGLALGSFIQCFDWERPSLDKIDLSEGSGTVLHKTKPLEAMCRARNVMEKVLQQISKA